MEFDALAIWRLFSLGYDLVSSAGEYNVNKEEVNILGLLGCSEGQVVEY